MEENYQESGPTKRSLGWYAAAFLFTFSTLLVFYSIYLSGQTVDFFISIDGYTSYQSGGPISMRISAVGTKEQVPLRHFAIKADLEPKYGGETLPIKKVYSDGSPVISIHEQLPATLPSGNYILKLKTSTAYGVEENEVEIKIVKDPPPHTLQIVDLKESYLRRSEPLMLEGFPEPVVLRLLANNGKYVPSILNEVQVILETQKDRRPLANIPMKIKLAEQLIAELKTDEIGMASFSYYPSTLNAHELNVEVERPDKSLYTGKFELRPWGAQIVARPIKQLLKKGEEIKFDITTLRPGDWHIGAYQGSNLLLSQWIETSSAKKPVSLNLPTYIEGPVYFQIASDLSDPTHAFDAFFVYIADPEETDLLGALKKDLSGAKGESFGPEILDTEILERWRKKVSLVKDKDFEPEIMAAAILSDLPKRFIVLPNLRITRESKILALNETRDLKHTVIFILLALAGLSLVGYIVLHIIKEVQDTKDRGFGIDFRPQQTLHLSIALAAVIVTYVFLLYFLSILDWHKPF